MPVITPYVSRPPHVEVGLLTDIGLVIDEHGNQRRPGEKGLLVFASVETVGRLLLDGHGEALTWDNVPKRWRPEVIEEEQWSNRATDVAVLALPNWPEETKLALEGLKKWRDWLESYGAHPTHSMGGSALSLMRATIRRPVWTMRGDAPPLRWVMGPRIYLPEYVHPMSTFRGAVHIDLAAAYPRAMAGLPFGDAIWRQLDTKRLGRMSLDQRHGFTPLVVRAMVRLPRSVHGVLVDRPTDLEDLPKGSWERCELLDGTACARYPRSGTVEGIWSWDELRVAAHLGADLTLTEGWALCNDGELPFWPWWEAVSVGRKLPRFAGQLAKACSNACWGALVPSRGMRRVVRPGGSSTKLPELPRRPSSYDLAELITARVRALGVEMMAVADTRLISFHTDGGWLTGSSPEIGWPWTVKGTADRLDIMDPQQWRYWPRGKADPLYTMAGVPREQQEHAWEEVWEGERSYDRRAEDEAEAAAARSRRAARRG